MSHLKQALGDPMNSLIDSYERLREELSPRLDAFAKGRQPYLIVQSAPLDVYTNCNTVTDVFDENIKFFERQLAVKSDWLPYLEPWMGTGVYANAFGCEYMWREGDSPAAHYRYHSLEEVVGLPALEISDSPIMAKVLDTIAYFREHTGDSLPIALTDTQSANDTATLVVDAASVLMGCYTEPETIHSILRQINSLIIEFSKRQIEAIGTAPMARPGHIMASHPDWTGIAISDDNLAVVSPEIGREFCLKYDQELADAFGGLAIHSCGKWQHLMPDVAEMQKIRQIDCAIHTASDPTPNDPEAVRDAFSGSGIAVKVRGPHNVEEWPGIFDRLVRRDLRLIVQLYRPESLKDAERNYNDVDHILQGLYS